MVKSASSAEIRDLQIKSAGQGYSYSIALLIKEADTSVRDLIILSENASGTNWGIRHASSTAKVDGVTITAKGGNTILGFSHSDYYGGSEQSPIIERTMRITSSKYGIVLDGGRLRLTNSTIDSGDAGVLSQAAGPIYIENSQVRGGSYGVFSSSSGLATVTIDHSEIAGNTNAVNAAAGPVYIGATRPDGGPVSGIATCAGVYDESFTFFAGPACP